MLGRWPGVSKRFMKRGSGEGAVCMKQALSPLVLMYHGVDPGMGVMSALVRGFWDMC